MTDLVPILAAALGLLCLSGLVVLSLLPAWWRMALLPALPAVGALALVVGLHGTALVVPTRTGVWVLIVAGGVVLAVRSRFERWWVVDRGALVLAAAAVVCGTPALALAIAPARANGAHVVQVTLNNDGFAYVAVASWLEDHPATSLPVPDAEAPAYGYVEAHLRYGVRIGDELFQAAAAAVTGHDPAQNWYAITCLFLLLVPGSAAAAFRILELRGWTGLAAGSLAGVSALLSFQAFNSNSDSLLGIAVAPVAIALLAARLGNRDPVRPPLWLVAGALAGFAGSYTEYLPLVVPGLALFALARAPRAWLRLGIDSAAVVAVSALMAPLVWYDAVRSVRIASIPNVGNGGSPFTGIPIATFVERFLGLARLDGAPGHPAAAFMTAAGVVGLGVIGAWGSRRWRWLMIGLAVNMLVVIVELGHDRGYTQARAAEIALPLVLLISAIGADVLVTRASAARPGAARAAAAGGLTLAAIGAVVLGGVNLHTGRQEVAAQRFSERYVTDDFADVPVWLRRYAGPGGGGAAVMDEDFFEQLWLVYSTRSLRQVAYPFLFPDYVRRTAFNWHPPRQTVRWVVIGRLEALDADPGVVVASNAHFRLLDLTRGGALVVLPTPPVWADGQSANWIADGGTLMTLRTPDVGALAFGVERALPRGSTAAYTLSDGAHVLWAGGAGPKETAVNVPLPPAAFVEIRLARTRSFRADGRSDPEQPFWVHLGNIRRGTSSPSG